MILHRHKTANKMSILCYIWSYHIPTSFTQRTLPIMLDKCFPFCLSFHLLAACVILQPFCFRSCMILSFHLSHYLLCLFYQAVVHGNLSMLVLPTCSNRLVYCAECSAVTFPVGSLRQQSCSLLLTPTSLLTQPIFATEILCLPSSSKSGILLHTLSLTNWSLILINYKRNAWWMWMWSKISTNLACILRSCGNNSLVNVSLNCNLPCNNKNNNH